MSKFTLIKIEGKALEKLIDVISSGVRTLYKPREIRNVAEAEAYKIKVLSKVKAEATAIANEIDWELQTKIESRLSFQESKRHLNIENVTYGAAEELNLVVKISFCG